MCPAHAPAHVAHVETFTTTAEKGQVCPDQTRRDRRFQGVHNQRDAEARSSQRQTRPSEVGQGSAVSGCCFRRRNKCRGGSSGCQNHEQSAPASQTTPPCTRPSGRHSSNSTVVQCPIPQWFSVGGEVSGTIHHAEPQVMDLPRWESVVNDRKLRADGNHCSV